jgi:hypothetical protein
VGRTKQREAQLDEAVDRSLVAQLEQRTIPPMTVMGKQRQWWAEKGPELKQRGHPFLENI